MDGFVKNIRYYVVCIHPGQWTEGVSENMIYGLIVKKYVLRQERTIVVTNFIFIHCASEIFIGDCINVMNPNLSLAMFNLREMKNEAQSPWQSILFSFLQSSTP